MTPTPISVHQQQFDIIIHDEYETLSNVIRERGIYSYNDILLLSQILREGDTFIDVGANIGWHTLFCSKVVGSLGRVYSIEPIQKNFKLLCDNIALNQLNQTTALNVALSDHNNIERMFCSSINSGDHVLVPSSPSQQHTTYENVQCVTFDSLVEESSIDITKLRAIKIDAQGSEPRIFDGMKKMLTCVRPYILVEYSPKHIKACHSSPFEVFAFIDKTEYVPYFVRETYVYGQPQRNMEIFEPITIEDMYKFTHHSLTSPGTVYMDVLLSPMEITNPDVFP